MAAMKRFFFLAALLALPAMARADDSDISYGGSPSSLKGTGQVAMQSEVVLLDIGPDKVRADCQFVFKNKGPACTIRMGFPDGNSQRDEESDAKAPIKSAFGSFQSFVDGHAAPTTLVRGKDYAWQTKTVSFPANGIRRVREIYTVEVGGTVAYKSSLETAYYVLQTGASWSGPIGRMEIIARFRRSKRAHPTPGNTFQDVRPISHAALTSDQFQKVGWIRPDEEVVVYNGPGAPQTDHNVLRWVRTNIRPTEKDDVFLWFKPKK